MQGEGDIAAGETEVGDLIKPFAAVHTRAFDKIMDHEENVNRRSETRLNQVYLQQIEQLNADVQEFTARLDSISTRNSSSTCSSAGAIGEPGTSGTTGTKNDEECVILRLNYLDRNLNRLASTINLYGSTYFDQLTATEDEYLVVVVEALDSITSSTVSLIRSIVNAKGNVRSTSLCMALNDSTTRLVTLLNSAFVIVTKSCHQLHEPDSASTFVNICKKYFSQILMDLVHLSGFIPSDTNLLDCHLENSSSGKDKEDESCTSLAIVINHLSMDYQLAILLPVLKQFGRLLLSVPKEMNEILDQHCLVLFGDTKRYSKRFGPIVKVLLEVLHEQTSISEEPSRILANFHTSFISWVKRLRSTAGDLGNMVNENEILSYLLVYAEYNTNAMTMLQLQNLVDEDFIELLQKCLMGDDLLRGKQALFILKSLTSFIRTNENSFFGAPEVEQHHEKTATDCLSTKLELFVVSDTCSNFTTFWSTFFELLEILDEKQLHIVEPCLQKLAIFEEKTNVTSLTLPWYFILLHKMCHHDNRYITNQGIKRFLNSASRFIRSESPEILNAPKIKQSLLDFTTTTILPLLKEKVCWIFPNGPGYFKCARQLGNLLAQMHSGPFKTTKFMMNFLNTSCEYKIMSPNSLFLMTTTLCHAVIKNQDSEDKNDESSSSQLMLLQDLTYCVQQFNIYIGKAFLTLDKFLKSETQKQLIDLFCSLLLKAVNGGVDFSKGSMKSNLVVSFRTETEMDASNSKLHQSMITSVVHFIGSIDYIIFCNSPSLTKLCQYLSNCIFDNTEYFNLHDKCPESIPNLLCGYLRLYFYKTFVPTDPSEAKLSLDPQKLFNGLLDFDKIASSQLYVGMSDFLNCFLYTKYVKDDRDVISQSEDYIYCNMFVKVFFQNLLQHCIGEGEIGTNRNHLNEAIADADLHFSNTLKLLEIIVDSIPSADIQNMNFQAEIYIIRTYLEEDFTIFQWGDNIYCDKIRFRLFHIFTQLNVIYHLPMPPCFEISYFIDTFTNTNINSKYKSNKDVANLFKTEFQQLRLRAFVEMLLGNPKEDVCLYLTRTGINLIWRSLLDLVDESGPGGIVPILDFASTFLSFTSSQPDLPDEEIHKFAEISWTHVLEMRKTDTFWSGIAKFVRFTGQPYCTEAGILLEYSKIIFQRSESIVGLSLVLMESIVAIDIVDLVKKKSKFLEDIVQICIQATYFGLLLSDNNKSMFEVWNYLKQVENGESEAQDYYNLQGRKLLITFSVFSTNANTRLLGITVIVKILNLLKVSNEKIYQETVGNIVMKLLHQNDYESRKKRYFCNSLIHRLKQRISQAILMLQPFFDQGLAQVVTASLLNSLANDNPQPSIRYFMEWIVIRNLIQFPSHQYFEEFFKSSRECCNTRVGFGAFLSTICLHAVLNLKDETPAKKFCDQSLQALSVLLIGQHSAVRPYAQACFRQIYQNFRLSFPDDYEDVLDRYKIIYDSLDTHLFNSIENNSFNYQKVENNFYIKMFNPLTHYCAQTVYIYLPRITNMSADELVQAKDLIRILGMENAPTASSVNALRNLYFEYENSSSKNESRNEREMDEEMPNKEMLVNLGLNQDVYQKKINPWKYLPISEEMSDFSEVIQMKKRTCSEDGLILVASLIEKVPNLGGLCRTCEIFGVSKYVMSSLRFLEDRIFQNLSVSAERWVNIEEVRLGIVEPRIFHVPKNSLKEFLRTYSAKGYTILGIEQASESLPLNHFKFPKKSILLLGHEKFGIPTELLQLVDQCLEIPQVGIIRSLNVHVTGALCIWQYASQHTL